MAANVSTDLYFLVDARHEGVLRGETPAYHRDTRLQIRNLLIIGVIAVVALLLVRWILAQGDRLGTFGIPATATVVNRYTEYDSQMDGIGTEYYLIYQYTVGEDTYQREARVISSFYALHFVDDRLTIRYLPDDPAVSEISGVRNVSFAPILCLGAVGLGVLVLFGAYQFRHNQKLKQSRLVEGVITRSDMRLTTERKPYIRLEYAFTAPDGKRIESAHALTGERWQYEPPPGAGVKVYVLYNDERMYQLL